MAKRINPELAKLREEVARRERAASNKISRLRRQGIPVAGSSYDPRRDNSRVRRYTRSQLQSYLNSLDEFTSRKSQFIAGASGTVLSRSEWNRFSALQDTYNKTVYEAALGRVGNIKVPGSDMNIRQREATFNNPNLIAMKGEAVKRPITRYNFEAHEVRGPDALKRLEKMVRKRMSGRYLAREIRKQRPQLLKMIDEMGDHALLERAAALTNRQFDILWNWLPGFARDLSHLYGLLRDQDAASSKGFHNDDIASQIESLSDMIDWASEV